MASMVHGRRRELCIGCISFTALAVDGGGIQNVPPLPWFVKDIDNAECRSLESCVGMNHASPPMYLQMTHLLRGRQLGEERLAVLEAQMGLESLRERQEWIRKLVRGAILQPLENMLGDFGSFAVRPRWTRHWRDSLGFHVNLLTLETRPRVHMPCALFRPSSTALGTSIASSRSPGVLFASGHDAASFRAPESQRIILNLALTGITVLACDPVSQGERHQYSIGYNASNPSAGDTTAHAPVECVLADDGVSSTPSCTGAHDVYGKQAALLNISLAAFFVWDALKALDFLEEVSSGPYGMLGCSGGGDLTAYVAAIDDRVAIAAIACWFTSWTDVLDKQVCMYDAEQIWFGALSVGLDRADLLVARAPKMTMVFHALQDGCFPHSAQGYKEVSHAFDLYGASDQLWWDQANGHHGWLGHQLQPLLDFFGNFYDMTSVCKPEIGSHYSYKDLLVTSTGQISSDRHYSDAAFMPELLVDVMNKYGVVPMRPAPNSEAYIFWLRSELPRLISHVLSPLELPKERRRLLAGEGRISADKLKTEPLVETGLAVHEGLWVLRSRGACSIVIKLFFSQIQASFLGNGSGAPMALLLVGVSNLWSDVLDPEAASIVRRAVAVSVPVFTVGLCGAGPYHRSVMSDIAPFLFGESTVALHTTEIIAAARFAKFIWPTVSLVVASLGEAAPATLHAAALAPSDLFRALALIEPLASYELVARSLSGHAISWSVLLFGVLKFYDLPDLLAAFCPKPLLIYRPQDPHLSPLVGDDAQNVYKTIGSGICGMRRLLASQVEVDGFKSAGDELAAFLQALSRLQG